MKKVSKIQMKHDELIERSKETIKKYNSLDRALTEPEKMLLRKAEIDLEYAEREQEIIDSFAGKKIL